MTDPRLDAVGIAHAILARRVLVKLPGLLDHEELKQDLAVHVLGALKYYRPDKGSLKTFVGMTFDQWWKNSIKERLTRQAMETMGRLPDVAQRPTTGHHELSPRAAEILARLPEHQRETAYYNIALGVPLKATAELTGVGYQTTSSRVRRARAALKEMA
jgi:RNA polymerase sigma factor (sigma-70 family)